MSEVESKCEEHQRAVHVYHNTKDNRHTYHYLRFINGKGPKWVITKEGNREPMSNENYRTATIDVSSYPLEGEVVRIPTDPEEFKKLLDENQHSPETMYFTNRAGLYLAWVLRNTCLINAKLDIKKFTACPYKFVEHDKNQLRLADLPDDVPYHQLAITHPSYSY